MRSRIDDPRRPIPPRSRSRTALVLGWVAASSTSGCDEAPPSAASTSAGPAEARRFDLPPFDPRGAVLKNFGTRYVLANPAEVNEAIWKRSARGERHFNAAYLGRLKRWLDGPLAGRGGTEFAAELRREIQDSFAAERSRLAEDFPELPERLLLTAHVTALVHGWNEFRRQTRTWGSLPELLGFDHGDCDEISAASSAIFRLLFADVSILDMTIDYETELGGFFSNHSLVLAGGVIVDPTVDLLIDCGVDELRGMEPERRFSTLLAQGRVYFLHNHRLVPEVRRVAVEEYSTDGGVLSYFWPWYLRGLDQGDSKCVLAPVPEALLPSK